MENSLKFNSLMRFNAWFALTFASTLTLIETVHNWGDWGNPAFWVIDYLACLLLFGGGFLVLRRNHPGGSALLAAGWGFACAMFWMAYFTIRAEMIATPGFVDPIILQFALGLFVWTAVGLVISLILIARGNAAA